MLGPTLAASLVAIHVMLTIWAGAGLVEWVFGSGFWPRITNPDLPRSVLLLHWLVPLTTGAVFLVGWLMRWPVTPDICIAGYVSMATICAIETTTFLTAPSRYFSMAVEYLLYVTIGALLLKSEHFRTYFAASM